MTKKEFLKLKVSAHEDGENDTYLQEVLYNHALLLIESLPEYSELSSVQIDALIDAYEDGFFGKPLK